MADLNALIAQGAQFKAPPDPFAQYAQMQQLQHGQNQNALTQYQLENAKRADVQQNALNLAYSQSLKPDGTVDYNKLTQSLAGAGAGSLIPGATKQQFEAQKAQREAAKAEGDLVDQRLKQSRLGLEGVTTPEQFLVWHQSNHADPILGKYLAERGVTAEQSRARIDAAIAAGPQAFQQLLNESKLGTEKAMENHFIEQTSGQQRWTSAVPKFGPGAATIVPGTIVNQVMTPGEASTAATALAGQRITARGQDIVAGTAAKALAQAGNLPLQESLAAARERGTLTTKNEVAAKAILPKVIADAEVGLAAIDGMIGSAQVDKKSGKVTFAQGGAEMHPGFGQSVGVGVPGLKYVHGTAEADFDALYKQVMGGAFLDAYESLRGANAITDIEGAKGTAAKTRLSTAQSEVEFVRAARELQSIMRKGVERARAKAGAVSGGNPHAAKTDAQIKAELGL